LPVGQGPGNVILGYGGLQESSIFAKAGFSRHIKSANDKIGKKRIAILLLFYKRITSKC